MGLNKEYKIKSKIILTSTIIFIMVLVLSPLVFSANVKNNAIFGKINEVNSNLFCGDMITADTTLTSDLVDCSGNGLIIGANNVVLDCAGHLIIGQGLYESYGIMIARNNSVVKNCIIEGFYTGIFSANELSEIINNTVYDNSDGIYLFNYASFAVVANNTINNNGRGLVLASVFGGANVTGNNIFNNTDSGIYSYYSRRSEFRNNEVSYNGKGFKIVRSPYITDRSKIIENKITNNSVGLVMDSSSSVMINSNIISGNSEGIHIYDTYGYGSYVSSCNNYFDNILNAKEEVIGNPWSCPKMPGENIIGGPYTAGNFWHDYLGRDTDFDGIGNTQLPYTSNGNIISGGDNMPLAYNCGDLNNDFSRDILDVVSIINIAFRGGSSPNPPWIADINGDGIISDVLDVVLLINHVFRGAPEPTCSPTTLSLTQEDLDYFKQFATDSGFYDEVDWSNFDYII